MKSVFKRLFQSGSPAENSTSPEADPSGLREKPALQGDIAAISLDDVFQLFDYAGLTGELEVQHVDNNGFFFFEKGVLIFGMLAENRQRLGEMLLDEGYITAEQLDECLSMHKEDSRQRLGRILLAQAYVSEDELVDSLGRQAKSAVFEALSWKEGSFYFHINKAPDDGEVLLRERVDHLLLEGMVHIDENSEHVEDGPVEEIF